MAYAQESRNVSLDRISFLLSEPDAQERKQSQNTIGNQFKRPSSFPSFLFGTPQAMSAFPGFSFATSLVLLSERFQPETQRLTRTHPALEEPDCGSINQVLLGWTLVTILI
jgi:hypothetical protein